MTSQPKQRRVPGRNLNVAAHGSAGSECRPRETAPEVPLPSQYPKSLRTTDPKFVHPMIQRPNARKLSAVRPEQESYYENYYTTPSSLPGRSNAFQIYRQQNPEELDDSTYEDGEEEEEEEDEEEDEIDALDYIPDPPQQKRHILRTQEYYPTTAAREVSYCDPYISQAQRRISKSPVRSYDIQQPTSDGILPPRPRSPLPYTRQQMSEPFHGRYPQNKAGKLTSRSCYDSEGRLYTRNHSPESEFYDNRTQDYHLLGKPRREKLLEEIRQQREGEDLKQIFPNSEDTMLGHGNEESTKASQQRPLSPRDCLTLAAKEDEYLQKLQHLFREEANDVEKLIAVKKAELERRNARNRSPVGSFHQ